MLFVVSGEGKTDFGGCSRSHPWCDDNCYSPGPMHVVLKKTAAAVASAQPSRCYLVHKKQLEKSNAPMRSPLNIRLPGTKGSSPYFFENARALGAIANKIAKEQCEPVVAVLFRDCDFTRNENPERKWQGLHASVQGGFAAARCTAGVPMIPLPKSETWLYCAHPKVSHDDEFETKAGNDSSQNSWKSRLEGLLGVRATQSSLTEFAQEHFHPQQIKLSKYLQFKTDLGRAITAAEAIEE